MFTISYGFKDFFIVILKTMETSKLGNSVQVNINYLENSKFRVFVGTVLAIYVGENMINQI